MGIHIFYTYTINRITDGKKYVGTQEYFINTVRKKIQISWLAPKFHRFLCGRHKYIVEIYTLYIYMHTRNMYVCDCERCVYVSAGLKMFT